MCLKKKRRKSVDDVFVSTQIINSIVSKLNLVKWGPLITNLRTDEKASKH